MNTSFDWELLLSSIFEFFIRNGFTLAFTLVLLLLLGRLVAILANRYIHDEEKRHIVKKWTGYSTLIIAFLWILSLYGFYRRKDIFFILGIFLAGVLLSLRGIFSNFLGWLLIISSKGFSHGDRVKIGAVTGDVIDIGIFRTVLSEIGEWVEADQSNGRLVTIPNSMVLENPVHNYTIGHDLLWNEIKTQVTFESN